MSNIKNASGATKRGRENRRLRAIITTGLVVFMNLVVNTPHEVSGEENNLVEKVPQWHQLDKALALAKESGKHIVVNFYTDWCPNCKRMDERTYHDDNVLEQLKDGFISVKINAESSKLLIIKGQTVTEEQIANMFKVDLYPTTWFLSPDGRPLMPLRGYYGPKTFKPVLQFVKGKWYESMTFDIYMKRKDKK